MKLNTIALLCGLFLTGCQTTQTLDLPKPSLATALKVQQLDSQKLELPSSTNIVISDSTQKLNNKEIRSPIVSILLPVDKGALHIEITSKIEESVFSPMAFIYDENENIIQSIHASDFNYVKPRLAKGNRLVTDFSFMPPQAITSATLVIYTSQEELTKTTNVIHPARLDAEARGNYFPEAKDIPIPHSLTGEILIDISSYSSHSFFEAKKKPADNVEIDYKNNIQKAVAENDISKALALLEEAKKLGIKDIETVFVNALEEQEN